MQSVSQLTANQERQYYSNHDRGRTIRTTIATRTRSARVLAVKLSRERPNPTVMPIRLANNNSIVINSDHDHDAKTQGQTQIETQTQIQTETQTLPQLQASAHIQPQEALAAASNVNSKYCETQKHDQIVRHAIKSSLSNVCNATVGSRSTSTIATHSAHNSSVFKTDSNIWNINTNIDSNASIEMNQYFSDQSKSPDSINNTNINSNYNRSNYNANTNINTRGNAVAMRGRVPMELVNMSADTVASASTSPIATNCTLRSPNHNHDDKHIRMEMIENQVCSKSVTTLRKSVSFAIDVHKDSDTKPSQTPDICIRACTTNTDLVPNMNSSVTSIGSMDNARSRSTSPISDNVRIAQDINTINTNNTNTADKKTKASKSFSLLQSKYRTPPTDGKGDVKTDRNCWSMNDLGNYRASRSRLRARSQSIASMTNTFGKKQTSLIQIMTKETVLMIFAFIGSLFGLIAMLMLLLQSNNVISKRNVNYAYAELLLFSIDITFNAKSISLTWPFAKKRFDKICSKPIKYTTWIYANKVADWRAAQTMVV